MPVALQHNEKANDRTGSRSEEQYSAAMNPSWAWLLKLLQMDVGYEHCIGTELFTVDGRRILDFLSGYCVHNPGHNHPALIESTKKEVALGRPGMLRSHIPELSGNWRFPLLQ